MITATAETPPVVRHRAANVVVVAGRWLLGAVFIYMGLNKALHPVEFLKLVRQYNVTDHYLLLNLVASALPWFEIFCGLLLVLGLAGWKKATILMRRLWVFGLILLIPHALVTNFMEVRAQIGTMLCMLPLALRGVLSISELAGPRPDRAAGGA